MFKSRFNRRNVSSGNVRWSSHLRLEYLEERLVMDAIPEGQLLMTSFPGSPDYTKAGVIAVNPAVDASSPSSNQTPIALGDNSGASKLHIPSYVSEAPDGQVYVTDEGKYDDAGKNVLPNSGAIVAISPTDRSQRIVASGLNGPVADAFVNGSVYAVNVGNADRTVHNLVKINPLTGEQQTISVPDNGKVSSASADPLTITDNTKDWMKDQWKGWSVVIVEKGQQVTAPDGEGQIRTVVGNDATHLWVDQPWEAGETPDAGWKYAIGFALPVGMARIPNNASSDGYDPNYLYVADEAGDINLTVSNAPGEYPGAIWKVDFHTGQETIVTYADNLTSLQHGPYQGTGGEYYRR
jgi:hypothetical protein